MDYIVEIILVVFLLLFSSLVILKRGFIEKIRKTLYPYPLSSGHGDKMFPDKDNIAGWVEYVLLSILFIIFITHIILIIFNPSYDNTILVGMICAPIMMFAGIAHKFSEEYKKDKERLEATEMDSGK